MAIGRASGLAGLARYHSSNSGEFKERAINADVPPVDDIDIQPETPINGDVPPARYVKVPLPIPRNFNRPGISERTVFETTPEA